MKWRLIIFCLILWVCNCNAAYNPADLPSNWGIDLTKIQGMLLPVLPSNPSGTDPIPTDPNTWLQPIGDFIRDAQTNQWVSRIEWVTTNTSDSVFLHQDPDTGMSTNWILDGWIMPGPNYKVMDAYTWKGRSGTEKKQRFTVFVVGYVPLDVIPILY